MLRVKLEYGRTRRPDVRRGIKRLALISSVVVTVLASGWYAAWRIDRLQRDRLTAYFNGMPEVASVYVDGYSEDSPFGLDYRVTGVGVRLKQPPDGFIWFDETSVRSIRDVREIRIGAIGPLRFEQDCKTSPYSSKGYSSVGIGPAGEFAGRVPLKVDSATDVVANYSRLISALEALPPTGVVTHADGDTYTYEITSGR